MAKKKFMQEDIKAILDKKYKKSPNWNWFNHRKTKDKDIYDFEDDGFIHIERKGEKYVFYNGQDKDMLKQSDVKKFSKAVDIYRGEN